MDDFRTHRAWCPHGRPPSGRRLDLAIDHGAFPVWEWVTVPAGHRRPARKVHANVGPEYLRQLSADLAAALQAWANWADEHQQTAWLGTGRPPPSTEEDWRRWRDHGDDLARRLADETGAEVVHRPHLVDNCPHCQPRRAPGSDPT